MAQHAGTISSDRRLVADGRSLYDVPLGMENRGPSKTLILQLVTSLLRSLIGK